MTDPTRRLPSPRRCLLPHSPALLPIPQAAVLSVGSRRRQRRGRRGGRGGGRGTVADGQGAVAQAGAARSLRVRLFEGCRKGCMRERHADAMSWLTPLHHHNTDASSATTSSRTPPLPPPLHQRPFPPPQEATRQQHHRTQERRCSWPRTSCCRCWATSSAW